MSRVYIFCEGKRDRLFLKKLIKQKRGVQVSEYKMEKLNELLRKERFEGIALIECGGSDMLLKQAARRARDLVLHPKTLPHAGIIVVGDSDKVDTTRFRSRLDDVIQKLQHTSPLAVREEGAGLVVVENLREQHYTVSVVVLTIPYNLEKQIADCVRKLIPVKVGGLPDEKAIKFYCDERYGCDEEEMMNNDKDVIDGLLDSRWADEIIKSL